MSIDEPISSNDFNICLKVLSKFNSKETYSLIESNEFSELRPLIHQLFHIEKRIKKKRLQADRQKTRFLDRSTKNSCLLRSGRAEKLQQLQLQNILVPDGTVEIALNQPAIEDKTNKSIPKRLISSTPCYICKLKFRTLHFFYDRLCPSCAKLNFEKRIQTTDLTDRIALVTGARVKIGYRILLKLLRANCFVIATTRFPVDLLNRLNQEDDFNQWNTRVHIYGVDFRYQQLIEEFTKMLIDKYDRLDFLINNACQTIQRPKEYYQHLIANERLNHYSTLAIEQRKILDGNLQFYTELFPQANHLLYQTPADQPNEILPKISFDVNQQPLDLRSTNSWMLRLADLSTTEINEVLTINTLAPFILNSKLKVLMADKHPTPDSIKFIINVSAMEGSFSRTSKTDRHPHTNAAKAALNMMTRTSASDYKKSNIYMVSVDTGWINDEKPVDRAYKTMITLDFQTPLDEEDAAARILDPIIHTYRQLTEGKTDIDIPHGCFLKDYQQCNW